MTSMGVPSPLELWFSIDGRPGVLRAVNITAALGLPAALANSGGYRAWPQQSQRDGPLSRSRYYSGTPAVSIGAGAVGGGAGGDESETGLLSTSTSISGTGSNPLGGSSVASSVAFSCSCCWRIKEIGM